MSPQIKLAVTPPHHAISRAAHALYLNISRAADMRVTDLRLYGYTRVIVHSTQAALGTVRRNVTTRERTTVATTRDRMPHLPTCTRDHIHRTGSRPACGVRHAPRGHSSADVDQRIDTSRASRRQTTPPWRLRMRSGEPSVHGLCNGGRTVRFAV